MRARLAQNQLADHDMVVIQLEGALNASTVTQFHHHLHRAITADGYSSVLVSLEQVEQIDSAGLMVLVSAFKLARKFQKQLFLCSVSAPVRMILEMTRLDQVFQVVEPVAIPQARLGQTTAFRAQPADLVAIA